MNVQINYNIAKLSYSRLWLIIKQKYAFYSKTKTPFSLKLSWTLVLMPLNKILQAPNNT